MPHTLKEEEEKIEKEEGSEGGGGKRSGREYGEVLATRRLEQPDLMGVNKRKETRRSLCHLRWQSVICENKLMEEEREMMIGWGEENEGMRG
ncbi:hypothetical protein M0802_006737 [Mischocyttarus mexicanus]|nr:hypothetical protein M0802_006737 [Mischocyttarus mexicanus]